MVENETQAISRRDKLILAVLSVFIMVMSAVTVGAWHYFPFPLALFVTLVTSMSVFLVCGLMGIELILAMYPMWLFIGLFEGAVRGFTWYSWIGGAVGLVLGIFVCHMIYLFPIALIVALALPRMPPTEPDSTVTPVDIPEP